MSEPSRTWGRDADGKLRPWDVPGNVRRDAVPHRGLLLLVLGGVALLFGFASPFLVFPAVVAVPLGIAVWRMAGRDLHEMRWGRMHPEGRRNTALAQLWGMIAVLLGLLFWMPLALMYLVQA
jgi:uncharacterized membrane protein YccF (DUF307 family)